MHPLNYLHTHGPHADKVTALTWGLMLISVAVVVIITGLVLMALRRNPTPDNTAPASIPVTAGAHGLSWLTIGVGVSTAVLLASVIWTVEVVAAVGRPPGPVAFTIDVTGEQFWWAVRYNDADPARVFMTANEIHIPVGKPVLVRLHANDVIHSFWVPGLAGKTDTIPGQTNVTWLQADRPGRYRGQCTEFCGLQHANMGLEVVADAPADFEAWWAAQAQPAKAITSEHAAGAQAFAYRCGACHAVRGTDADGTMAPDLTHLMSRGTIAAATLPNTIGNLSAWMADPQGIKPGTMMPDLNLSGREITEIGAFLVTLK